MATVLLVVFVIAVVVFLRRANELCAIRVKGGVSRLIRGRAPIRFLSDVDDIVHRAGLPRGTLRVLSESGSPHVVPDKEFADAVAQQLRNAAGQHTIAQFRTGRRPR